MKPTLSEIPCVILAGGLATRMRPLTEKIPKSLLEAEGHPFIYYQLNWLKKQGVQKVVLCLGFLGEMVEDYVGDGSAWGLSVEYSYDGDKLLGTGGALFKALPKVKDYFWVLYGDSFLPVDLQQIFDSYLKQNKPYLMTVYKNNNQFDRSNVVFKKSQLFIYDKKQQSSEMGYIDYGLELLRTNLFKPFKAEEKFDLADVLTAAVQRKEVFGVEMFERFYEIGSPQGLEDFKTLIKKGLI